MEPHRDLFVIAFSQLLALLLQRDGLGGGGLVVDRLGIRCSQVELLVLDGIIGTGLW